MRLKIDCFGPVKMYEPKVHRKMYLIEQQQQKKKITVCSLGFLKSVYSSNFLVVVHGSRG